MTKVTLHTRPGCHLCEAVEQVIRAAQQQREFEFDRVNIESNADLLSRYWDAIPVVTVNGREIARYRMTRGQLEQALTVKSAS